MGKREKRQISLLSHFATPLYLNRIRQFHHFLRKLRTIKYTLYFDYVYMEENNYPYQLPYYWLVCTKYDDSLKSFRS